MSKTETSEITGDTAAEALEIASGTTLLTKEAADLDEAQVTTWLSHQLESGAMQLEDLAQRMARYGLMDPAQFREEMAERMGLFEVEPDMPGDNHG